MPARSKPVLRDVAYRKFMELLLDGRQKPGLLVSQRELCEITGCSIGAVREALKRLEAEGIVSLIPQRGVMVREVDRKVIDDAYEVRRLIEIDAVRRYAKSADPDDLARIRAATEGILARRASTYDESMTFFREKTAVDERLHQMIVGAMSNRLVDEIYERINNQLRVSRLSVHPRFSASLPAMTEHLAIIDALERRDGECAARAMAEHLEASHLRALGLA